MKTNQKIVSVSLWYLIIKFLMKIGIFTLLLFPILMIFVFIFQSDQNKGMTYGLIVDGLICFMLFFGDFLYWKNSGIYLDNGDHVVRTGGWYSEENKLLGGVVIANNVTRSPVDQILGMATIQAGIWGRNKGLSGIKYADIKNYDDKMRKGSGFNITSMF